MIHKDKSEAMFQCLTDAGCDNETIDRFLLFQSEGKTAEGFCLLSKHRRQLLDAIHKEQKRLDVLDYLIYTIKKKEERT